MNRHQGTEPVPVDFIIPAVSHNEIGKHHEILLANVLAQAEALMKGKTPDEAAAELRAAGKDEAAIEKLKLNKSFDGNRPSNMELTTKQKAAFGIGAVGKDMVYALSASYVMYYYQDVLGLSATFVGPRALAWP